TLSGTSEVSILASLRAARRASSSAGLRVLFVARALATRRFARRDDADDFFTVLFDIGMNHQKGYRPHEADRGPALLSMLVPIGDADMQRIVKDQLCDFEAYAVLGFVGPVLD